MFSDGSCGIGNYVPLIEGTFRLPDVINVLMATPLQL